MALQPALFECLLEDLSIPLRRDPFEDHVSFAAHALKSSLFKKYCEGGRSKAADDLALEKFLSCNRDMEVAVVSPNTSLDEMLLGDYFGSLTTFFEAGIDSGRTWWTLPECFKLGYSSPGAAVGARGHDFYTKFFDSPISATTASLYESFADSLDFDPVWAQAESLRLSRYGFSQVQGSHLSFVPKTQDVSRTVCTEPSLNMFYQLGFGLLIVKELRRQFGISLSSQPQVNRNLARLGSIDGSYSTIDLESASDRLGFHLLPKRFPGIGLIHHLRSPSTRLPDGRWVPLHMISSMGNGFTFPLMTLIFVCVIVSAYRSLGITPRFGRTPNCAVFGDDLIIVPSAKVRVLRLLALLGMKVNAEKSFFEGPFRESCGADYFNGFPVRGVYCKKLSTLQDRVSLVNRLNRWSYETGQPVPRTVSFLLTEVPRNRVVPLFEADDCGVQVPLRLCPSAYRFRNWSPCYLAWEPKPIRLRFLDSVVVGPRTSKTRQLNALGTLVCLLEGSLSSSRITLRNLRGVSYRTKLKMGPGWDSILAERFYSTVHRKRLERAYWLNLAGWLDINLV